MGALEKRNKGRMRRTKINKAVIAVVAAAGLVAVAAVAPNAVALFAKIGTLSQQRRQARTALGRMIQKGYLSVEERGGEKCVRLTEKGERFAALMNDGALAPRKPTRWDGKWRIVMYDLREPAKTLRARMRELLLGFGFYPLQKSVWVYPYDSEDFIGILKHELRLGGNVIYVIADEIESDESLRRHFGLKSRAQE